MTQFLMITPERPARTIGGREQLSALHEACLRDLLGDRLTVRLLAPSPPSGARGLLSALGGRIDGVTAQSEAEIAREVAVRGFDQIWLDGSNLGRLAKAIKRAAPGTQVATFCHNVEARFFLGGFGHRPGLRAAAVVAANFAAERLAVRHSDRLIALSSRDSALFKRLYRRPASDLLPLAIEDRLHIAPASSMEFHGLLFVGGAFYANLAGIRWFASEVAPHIVVPTRIAGRGFEPYRDELEKAGSIEVVGGVDELAPYYAAARAVIAPIFDGSGMKTKVAEALMFGKPVIGTREAFSGYEEVAGEIGQRADTTAEWIAAIGALGKTPSPTFDPALRRLYEQRYSRTAARGGIAAILGLR